MAKKIEVILKLIIAILTGVVVWEWFQIISILTIESGKFS
jgi:hypothetical protein